MAHRSRRARAPAAASATSAPTPTTSPTSSPGSTLDELCAELTTFVPGRALDDNVQIMLRYANGARGAAVGQPGGARQRERPAGCASTATKGGLEWAQDEPEPHALVAARPEPTQIVTRSGAGAGAATARVTRVPAGPSRRLSRRLRHHLCGGRRAPSWRRATGEQAAGRACIFPTIDDGVKGLAFIEAAIRSSKANGAWVKL